jgi:LPS export ABC transporter protein LptC
MTRLRIAIAAAGLVAALQACVEEGIRPGVSMTVTDSADQKIIEMSTRVFEDGMARSHVTADTAYVYQARQVMDLRNMRVTFYDEQGVQSSVLTARQGMYTMTNGSLDARGGVRVESTDGKLLLTEHLIYDKTTLEIRSDTLFTYTSPTERLTGNGFKSDLDFRNVVIDQPRGQQRGEGVALPQR